MEQPCSAVSHPDEFIQWSQSHIARLAGYNVYEHRIDEFGQNESASQIDGIHDCLPGNMGCIYFGMSHLYGDDSQFAWHLFADNSTCAEAASRNMTTYRTACDVGGQTF